MAVICSLALSVFFITCVFYKYAMLTQLTDLQDIMSNEQVRSPHKPPRNLHLRLRTPSHPFAHLLTAPPMPNDPCSKPTILHRTTPSPPPSTSVSSPS